MRTAIAAVALAVLLTACGRPANEAPAQPATGAAEAWTAAVGPTFSLATVRRGDRGPAVLALSTGGQTRWLSADGRYEPGPALPAAASHLAAVDLDGDQVDEIIVAAPQLGSDDPAAAVCAYELGGRRRWCCRLKGTAPILDLAAAPIGGQPAIVVAAQAPVGLVAVTRDGRPAFSDPTIRSALAVALPRDGSPRILAGDDRGLLHTYDPAGEPQAARPLPITATALLAWGPEQALVVGNPVGANDSVVARIDGDGRERWRSELGRRLELRDTPAAHGRFRPEAQFAVIDAEGDLAWFNENGQTGTGPRITPPIFCLAAGATVGERQQLLVGTSRGVTAIE